MTNEQKVIAANSAYIEELIRDVDRIEKSRDYVTNEYNRECNKLVAAEKELQEAQVKNLDLEVKNLDLEVELEDTQKQLKAANESSEGLTQDVIQSEKRIAELREQLEKMTGERDEVDKLVTYLRTGKDEFRKECDRLTNSNKALKLALELKQLNGPDVSELKKEIRQLQDQNDELTRMCAPDPDIPTEHVKTADEIREMCGVSMTCSDCGKDGKNGVDGAGGCRFSLHGMLPFEWSTEDIDAIDAIIKFATAPEETE